MTADVIAGLHAIIDRFDHVLLDQWGPLHQGEAVFPAARDCVARLRAAGKRVLVLSNSGRRAADNAQRLATLGLAAEAYDGIITSGEVTWLGLKARALAPFTAFGRSCFLISRGGDHSIVDGLDLRVATNVADAEFILLGGLEDDRAEPELWRPLLTQAAARGLPMLCANPDLVMFTARGLVPASGALAALYRTLGGKVDYVGKPHAPIFAASRAELGDPPSGRIVVIGDSLDHDIVGGRAAGMLTLLVTSGVHREKLANAADPRQAVLALAGNEARTPHWIMDRLAW